MCVVNATVRDLRDGVCSQCNCQRLERQCVWLQANLERQLRELEKGCVNRRNMLEESKKYHAYTRDCNELDEWIAEQMQVASSEDYGQDFEHLQVTIELMITTVSQCRILGNHGPPVCVIIEVLHLFCCVPS